MVNWPWCHRCHERGSRSHLARQMGEEGDGLHSLAQPHLVREDTCRRPTFIIVSIITIILILLLLIIRIIIILSTYRSGAARTARRAS
jgi:hypothetical protein